MKFKEVKRRIRFLLTGKTGDPVVKSSKPRKTKTLVLTAKIEEQEREIEQLKTSYAHWAQQCINAEEQVKSVKESAARAIDAAIATLKANKDGLESPLNNVASYGMPSSMLEQQRNQAYLYGFGNIFGNRR